MILLLLIGAMLFYITNVKNFKSLPYRNYLDIALCSFTLSKIFTFLEHIFWSEILNLLEHILILSFTFFISIWIYKYSSNKLESDPQ